MENFAGFFYNFAIEVKALNHCACDENIEEYAKNGLISNHDRYKLVKVGTRDLQYAGERGIG